MGGVKWVGGVAGGADGISDHFTIARDRFAEAAALQGQVSFSLRPQSIHLYRQSPPASDRVCVVPGVVTQRAYLGEHWDYTVRPAGSALALRVTARPHEGFALDEKGWLELEDGPTRAARARLIDEPPGLGAREPPIRWRATIPTAWIEIGLTEGRNRQVRRMTAAVGFPALRLIRVAVGPYELGGLRPGESREG